MKLGHLIIVILASIALSVGIGFWLWSIPDGTKPQNRHTLVHLSASVVNGISIYFAILVPVILNALGNRWPFRIFAVLSFFFALLNIGPIFAGISHAEEPNRSENQVLSALWEFCLGIGILLFYLLCSICFLFWSFQIRRRNEKSNDSGNQA